MYRIGVDLGGTNIVAGVVDDNLKVISKFNKKTPQNAPYTEIIKTIYEASSEALKLCGTGLERVSKVGVCSPGTVNTETGCVEFAGNLNFHKVPLREELRKVFGKEIGLINDGNAITLGEALAGAGKGCKSVVCVALGTGVGGGYYCGGKLLTGSNFAAGEFGHTVIEANGKECKCGRRGCFEAYCSATALVKQTKEKMLEDGDSLMWTLSENEIENVTAKTAFDAAKKGDVSAKQVVDHYIGRLACGVTNLVNIFQPEVLCICGGVANEGEYLIEPLRQIVVKERFSKYAEKQTVICQSILKDSAGIIGAALSEE